MPRPWVLTRAAEASLVEIALWTTRTFGPRQANLYEEDLIAACRAVAAGTALSYGCRDVIDPGLPEVLRFTRAGQHLVVFVEQADAVIIVDVLHSSSDLPRRLADRLPEG
jgi:plasmid stabilization system protein ParE